MITATSSVSSTLTNSSSNSTSSAVDMQAAQDRFLKLLVAQLNNQDPMNPMDNAEMTTQMAQINTVTGIQQVNETLKSLADQFSAMQVLQGSNMVGHNVLMEGNSLVPVDGTAVGAIDLSARADSVKVEVLSTSGQVIDTINAGGLDAGRHYFSWDASSYQGTGNPTFRVVAKMGEKAISATPLSVDKVISVGMENGAMSLQLQDRGATAYSSIKAIL
ncbi:MAG: flagellar hook assembly protein FlgD [Rhodoferax sp.]|uniref:flagellar hook assembly protein FlgD n=1 Tax=Rhodoferax sp. TaxID=50421 RepID=UPI001B41DBCA|nr:flagellar hook capping FlgD N-terminal domain-containing protein [Rhodoferax sp.]MBP9907127.1 flagellar hook assembly protein FlgD [Rhodoferax sp.]